MGNTIRFLILEDYKIMNLRGSFYSESILFSVHIHIILFLWNITWKIAFIKLFFFFYP